MRVFSSTLELGLPHPQLYKIKNMAEEPCTYKAGGTAPVTIFNNYKFREPKLACLKLFEYCMLIRTKNVRDVIADDGRL